MTKQWLLYTIGENKQGKYTSIGHWVKDVNILKYIIPAQIYTYMHAVEY